MEEESITSPLLQEEKVYHPGCPGCANDRRKELQEGLPYKEFLYVWIICLATSLPVSSLFPFLYFMIRDLHVAKGTEDIGFYAGFVGASFMLGRCLTSTVWGIAADRFGRKPVAILGVFSVLGHIQYFILLGALNGLLGPIKSYSIEVCRPEHEALGISLVGTAWGIGLIIGPALGGYLALPAEKFPNVFSPDSFFGRFPYFLPCLCTSLFATVVLVSCIWMRETLHKHKVHQNENKNVEALEAHQSDYKEKDEQISSLDDKKSLFKNWPFMSSLITYCVFSFHDMAYSEVFSLWTESDKKYGGLSLSYEAVGQVLSITGVSLLIYQLSVYPHTNKILGPIKTSRVAAILCILILFGYPYMTYLSGTGLSIILNIASILKINLADTIISSSFILQNNAVPQDQRGAANGLFSWAQARQHAFFFPGDQMVFFLLNAVEFLGLILTFKPFMAAPESRAV
ncbi:unnamed protein product [Miscanthus lutarioriparius]|uniref:Major facilitator superfamily (MFS) profile domain-containing protein n=1 Tax=Miscanthus lutarioriparius TaxID=422564 RepID=A0A811Q7B9_9POAL|nr:unnamed protein product [Miscanthus lutarioriparius]